MSKFITIIIPTYRDWKRLSLCLSALNKQSYSAKGFEVIVVNNDPDDLMPSDMQLAENTRVINERKPGSYAARNAGLQCAKGEIIGFTDSDCLPDKDWIQNAVTYFEQNPDCYRVGGKISIFSKAKNLTKVEYYDFLFAFNQQRYVENSGTCVTANMFTYRFLFDQVGSFDENLMSGGDFSWGKSASKAGYEIRFVENVIVSHPARFTLNELIKKEKRVGAGQGIFLSSGKSNLSALSTFLGEFRPRLGDTKLVLKKSKGVPLSYIVSVLLLRHYLLIVRGFEKYKVERSKVTSRR